MTGRREAVVIRPKPERGLPLGLASGEHLKSCVQNALNYCESAHQKRKKKVRY
jgi:hypothetical protein